LLDLLGYGIYLSVLRRPSGYNDFEADGVPYQGLGLGRYGACKHQNATWKGYLWLGDKYSQNDDVIEQSEVNATEKSRIIQANYLLLMIRSCTFALKRENSWATSRGY
jgi:hypothetical protein